MCVGGSVLVYDNDGLTPVHAALQHPLCVDTIIQLRIRSEPEILEVPTGDGLTPLMMAVHLGNYKVFSRHMHTCMYVRMYVCRCVSCYWIAEVTQIEQKTIH